MNGCMPHPALETPLSGVSAGRTAIVARFREGGALASRLAAMGLLPGVELRVCRNSGSGPVMLALKESRIMLGRGMAEQMWVRETAPAG